MELLAVTLSIACVVGLVIATLLWRSFMPAYVTEKAKNLASKEDLKNLTSLVEGVKASHTAEIERLKAGLATQAQLTERRRRVYEEVCGSLRVFIDGHISSDEAKQNFHSAYAATWLWASDEVVNALNRFIVLQKQHAADRSAISQDHLKEAYVSTVLAMRKDVGFQNTSVQSSSYQFVKFV